MHAIHALASCFLVLQAVAQQQPWTLSTPRAPPLSSVQLPLSSSGAKFWSLSTPESHQQPFPVQANVHRTSTNRSSGSAENSIPEAGGPHGTAEPALQWSLSNTNGSIQVDALFPSLAHLDLLRAGVIDDPAIGLNEGLYRWIIDEPTWTYTADLTPILELLPLRPLDHTPDHAQFWLYFQGLDTIAHVYLGGELLGSTSNQHKWYAFHVPTHLLTPNASPPAHEQPRNTNITLVFNNVNAYAAQQAARFDPGYPSQIHDPKPRTTDYEYPNRIFVRKQQSDFGWDWGPALVPVGPHKPAYLISLAGGNGAQIRDASQSGSPTTKSPSVVVLASGFDIYRKGQTNNLAPPDPDANWIVNVTLTLLSSGDIHWPSLRLSIPALGLYTFDVLLSSPVVSAGLNDPVHAVFEVPSGGRHGPLLWWPRGYGEPMLYEAVVQSDELHIEVTKKVGFRTAFFDLSPVSPAEVEEEGVQPGSYFRLVVNGQQAYVMGTNMIPLDTLSPRASRADLRWLLDSSLAAHVNLIRVWGGGSYPSAELLELCDELGVMVWMDAMFAASLYPYHAEFLDQVRTEVAQVMVDVVSHPSVVVVVGNNEGELYFLGAYGRRAEDAEWKRGYELLFDHTVRNQVLEASRALSYIPCSTTTGYLSLHPYRGRYDQYDAQIELHGTGEHYGYEAAVAFDINTYPRSRFMVEFGMFSLASIHTLDRILTNKRDYHVNSSVMRAHLKHPPAGNLSYPFAADQGQHELLSAITTYLAAPSAELELRDQLQHWSYSSQLYQLLYIANQIAVYRTGAAKSQRNAGLVVWQLNDVWQATSWSSVEYGGRWKMIHYGLGQVQAPMAVVAVYNATGETLEVNLVFSSARGEQLSVEMEWFSLTGESIHVDANRTIPLHLPQRGSGSMVVHTFHRPCNTTNTNGCLLALRLNSNCSLATSWACARSTTVYWTRISSLVESLTQLAIRPQVHLIRTRRWHVVVSNPYSAFAPFVWIQHGPNHTGYFALCHILPHSCRPHNAFWLPPNSNQTLTFIRPTATPNQHNDQADDEDDEDEQEWFHSLTVSSLFDHLPPRP